MKRCFVAGAALACLLGGCAPFSGTASLTLLAREPSAAAAYEPLGPRVEEETCGNWLLFFVWWGRVDSHETLVARALERTGADALVDARMTESSGGFPFIYQRDCRRVEGLPARSAARR